MSATKKSSTTAKDKSISISDLAERVYQLMLNDARLAKARGVSNLKNQSGS